jgi:hypothetical protein
LQASSTPSAHLTVWCAGVKAAASICEGAAEHPCVHGTNLTRHDPVRCCRVEAVECPGHHVQLGWHVGVQQPIGVGDGFVTARVDFCTADERWRQSLEIYPVRGDGVSGCNATGELVGPALFDCGAVEARGAPEFPAGCGHIRVEHRLVQ